MRLKRRRRMPQPSATQGPSSWLSKCEVQPCGSAGVGDGNAHGGLTPPAADDDASPVEMPAQRAPDAKRKRGVQRTSVVGRPRTLRPATRRSDAHGASSPVKSATAVALASRSSAPRQSLRPSSAAMDEPGADAACDRAGEPLMGRGQKRDISPPKREIWPPVAKSLRSSGRPQVDPELVTAAQDLAGVAGDSKRQRIEDETAVLAPAVPAPVPPPAAPTSAAPPVARVWKLRSPAGLVGA